MEQNHLLDSLPPDASPALTRLITMYSPLKSLQTLSADADLTLAQVNRFYLLIFCEKNFMSYLQSSCCKQLAMNMGDFSVVTLFFRK